MRAHAIVIGINEYPKNPGWNLTGAAHDAVEFVKWAMECGGVDPADLTLHLSPVSAAPAGLRVEPATIDAIDTTFSAYRDDKKGKGADRLWFYYAGHGLAPSGSDPGSGPLIIPCDVGKLVQYLTRPLGLEMFRAPMQNVDPPEQFYFVDACRDAIDPTDNKTYTQGIQWHPQGINDRGLKTQLILLATTIGRKAKELRDQGVFSKVLLDALRGMGPKLSEPHSGEPGKAGISFVDLSEFVRNAVPESLKEIPGFTPEDGESVPYGEMGRITGHVEVVCIDVEKLPKAKVTAIVDPLDAQPSAHIEFVQWSPNPPFYTPLAEPPPAGPPVQPDHTFEMYGGKHRVRVTADDFDQFSREILVYRPHKDYVFDLKRRPKPPGLDDGLESLSYGPLSFGPEPKASGRVLVRCSDPLARLTLADGGGTVRARGRIELAAVVEPGLYIARAEITASLRAEDSVIVEAGTAHDVPLEIAGSQPRLSSALAYAAWAARWPDEDARGVDRLQERDRTWSALQVLVGDALNEPEFLAGCTVRFDLEDTPRWQAQLAPVHELPALQASWMEPASRVRVTMPGFVPTTFAVARVPGFVTVLIVARETSGTIEVQQHFNPINPMQAIEPFGPPQRDDARVTELAWRALQNRDPLTANEYEELLWSKRSNPMLGVIAGYRMLKSEHADEFRTEPLSNMLQAFSALPDVHVLAGLYRPEQRDAHFAQATERGTPVLQEGFWALVEWLTDSAMRENRPAPTLRHNILPGMVWTAFTDTPRAARAADVVHVVTPAGRTSLATVALDRSLGTAAHSVARLDAKGTFFCSSFLLSPTIVVCPYHFAVEFAAMDAAGSWRLTTRVFARFDLAEGSSAREVIGVLRVVRPEGDDLRGGSLRRELLEQSWPALLQLAEPAPAPPLELAPEAPDLGDAVSVIGFARSDPRVPSATFAEHFAGASGEKHIMSGIVLREAGDTWTFDYDCFTADGVSGGAVVDRAGRVIGMHVAGGAVENGRKRAVGLALTKLSIS